MLCAISGTVPEEPVVSKKSGHLYEKRLILKVLKRVTAGSWVQETGRDPVTNEPLEVDELVELAASTAAKPRPTPATSIPGLLTLFQNEWDATVLEVHQLRQSLHTARQELSHALYQHDAATRVIARLVRERDGYRAQLEAAQRPAAGAEAGKRGPEGMEVEAPAKKAKAGITPDIAERLTATSAALSKGRKKRAISPSVATPEDIAGYGLAGTVPLHATNKLYDRAAGRVLASLEGHSKRVHAVRFVGSQVAGEGIGPGGYTCAALHPDGLILGAGTADATVRIWETRTQKNVAKFDGHTGPLSALSFSENGYYMASAAADGVKLWDLRKLKNFKSLAPYDSAPTTSVAFDFSGLFLAVGGADARAYGVKQDWAVVKEFTDVPKKGVQALAWGPDARSLLVGAADHNLRVFAAAE
eukprot:scaffold12.g8229.t1